MLEKQIREAIATNNNKIQPHTNLTLHKKIDEDTTKTLKRFHHKAISDPAS
jgi:hypothetical protein